MKIHVTDARDSAAPETGLEPAATGGSQSRAGPGNTSRRGQAAAPRGWDFFFLTRFFRGGSEGSEVWGSSSREEMGRRPLAPKQVQAVSGSRTPGKWGHGVPGNSGPGGQYLPGSAHSQSSEPPVPRAKCLLQTVKDKNTLISLSLQALGRVARSAAGAQSGAERAVGQIARRPHPLPCAGCCCSE